MRLTTFRPLSWVKALVCCLILALMLVPVIPQTVSADAPMVPHQFFGTVKINGTLAPTGYHVIAKIGGVWNAASLTDSQGRYGYTPTLMVSGTQGATIQFFINGVAASQTASFTSGEITVLNLTVTGTVPSTYTDPGAPTTLSISTSNLPGGLVATSYSTTLAATGGAGSYTFTVSDGSLPSGLSLSAAGAISGTPTTASTYSFTAMVTDSNSATATRTYSMTISPQSSTSTALAISTYSVSSGVVGTSYSNTLSATGGSGSYTFSLSSGSLPDGLSLSAAGAISGTPTTASTYSFTAMVTDSNSATATRTFSVSIASASSSTSTSTTTSSTSTSTSTPSSSTSTPATTTTTGATNTPTSTPTSTPGVSYSDLSVDPQIANAGSTVVVALRVANNSTSSVSKNVALNVNGVDEAKKTVELAPGKSQIVTFTVTKNDAGTYTVKAGDLSTSFQVKGGNPGPNFPIPQWPIIVIAVVAIIIVAVLIRILVMRGKDNY